MIFESSGAVARRLAGVPLAQQFLRFACVGLAATGVHYAILIALVEFRQIGPVPATTLGFVAGAFVSYVLNRRYTFKASGQFGPGLAKYYGALSVGLALNAIIVAVLSSGGLPYLLAQVVATGVVLIWNFLTARLVVFRDSG
ncbi:MAG: GtrA family protein [Hyphomicrobiaceae bacterium]